ncbi:MAG: hypothetical protein RLZZ308_676 [Candidatus Parcubacteria bacterium]|jgi:hypothetical protein
MLYSIVGTHPLLREKALKELASLGEVTRYVYSEQVVELEHLINAENLFGGIDIVSCVQLLDHSSSKETTLFLLERMMQSRNIFIIDEPFADVHKVNKLAKVSKKLFDAREEKKKDDRVFLLANAFVRKDKKESWLAWMAVRDLEGEAIQGALWWKFMITWQSVLEGRSSQWTKEECEKVAGKLLRAPILAHKGEVDLRVELEKIVLEV